MNALTELCIVIGATVIGVTAGIVILEICDFFANGCGPRLIARLAHYEELEEAGRLAEFPCNIGDDIWWIDDEEPFVKCEKGGVKGIVITQDGVLVMDRGNELYEIGTRYCYLTREDAERALEEGKYG